jgi:hypothetical protein
MIVRYVDQDLSNFIKSFLPKKCDGEDVCLFPAKGYHHENE